MYNRVILIGRTTKEVELRRTASGTSVATFTLAVEDKYAKKDGKATTNFINCVAWSNTADYMSKYIQKGYLVFVEGRIQTRNYDDRDGKKVYVTEIVVENLRNLERKKETTTNNDTNIYNQQQMNEYLDKAKDFGIIDDSLPF